MKQLFLLSSLVLAANVSLASAQAATVDRNSLIYRVANVAATDVLNLRAEPSASARIIAKLPSNGQGVLGLGEDVQIGYSTWRKVVWAGLEGWVNKRYLEEDVLNSGGSQRMNSDVALQCNGTEPFWSVNITEQRLAVDMLDSLRYSVPVDFRQQSLNNTSIAVVAGSNAKAYTTAFLQKVETCSDGMSDRNYPYSMVAVLNGEKVVSGCCNLIGVTR